MKLKIKREKNSDKVLLDYFKLKNPHQFRARLISNILSDINDEVWMFVDTNNTINTSEIRIDAFFENNNIEYKSYKIKEIEKHMLGIIVGKLGNRKPKITKRMYVAKINKDLFEEKLFMQSLWPYNLAFGINPKISFEEIVEDFKDDITETFFNKEYFDNFMYDSILFFTFRTNFEIDKYVLESEKWVMSIEL